MENEWIVNNKEEFRELRQDITSALERKNEAVERQRAGDGSDAEVEERKDELKEARKRWKRERRRWEREWWEGILI